MAEVYNGLICGDSDVLLQKMLDAGIKVDLVLTDPPYNLNKDFGNNSDKLSLEEYLSISKKRIELCRDLLTPNGSIYGLVFITILALFNPSCMRWG